MRVEGTDEFAVTMSYAMYRKIIDILERECLNLEYYFEVEEMVHLIDHLQSEFSKFHEEKKRIREKGR